MRKELGVEGQDVPVDLEADNDDKTIFVRLDLENIAEEPKPDKKSLSSSG